MTRSALLTLLSPPGHLVGPTSLAPFPLVADPGPVLPRPPTISRPPTPDSWPQSAAPPHYAEAPPPTPYSWPQYAYSGVTALLLLGLLGFVGLGLIVAVLASFAIWMRAVRNRDGSEGGRGGPTRGAGTSQSPPEEEQRLRALRQQRQTLGVPDGLDKDLLPLLPREVYDSEMGLRGPRAILEEGEGGSVPAGMTAVPLSGTSVKECPVCLCEYEQGDAICWLPDCGHAFHGSCIEAWLATRMTCPFCRVEVGPALRQLAELAKEQGTAEQLLQDKSFLAGSGHVDHSLRQSTSDFLQQPTSESLQQSTSESLQGSHSAAPLETRECVDRLGDDLGQGNGVGQAAQGGSEGQLVLQTPCPEQRSCGGRSSCETSTSTNEHPHP